MSEKDPNRTVPRGPAPAPEQTSDHVPADESSADPNRTAARPASETPAGTGTVARTPSDVARLEEDAKSRAAEGVPGYVLLGELGRGGMGVVYKARHLKLNRVVALKMLLDGKRGSGDELARFLAEAEAVAAIKHENVVQVFDYGEADGRPFMALEYLPGGSLAGALGKDRKPVRTAAAARAAARLLSQVARGVAAAHAAGIVHRDLKPANVLLDADGAPKVADFGLVKRGDASEMTRPGQVMGTPAYMSPEQAKGDSKFVGPPADVWALGVILYQALAGARPFAAENHLELLLKIATDEPAPPRKLAPAVPRDLELICLKCLAKNPPERYPTAAELADDLDRYLRHEPVRVRPAGPLERGYKWARRNKGASAAMVASAAGAVVLAGWLATLSHNTGLSKHAKTQEERREEAETTAKSAGESSRIADAKAREEERKRVEAESEQERAKQKARDAQYFGNLARAAALRYRDPPGALALLADNTACPTDRREVAWSVLHRICRQEYLTLPNQLGWVVAVSRDSKTLALGTTGPKSVVRLLDVDTGRARAELTGHTADIAAVAFSADGKTLASASADGTVRLWDPVTGAPGRVLKGWENGVHAMALSPDGRWLAAGPSGNPIAHKGPTAVKLWDLAAKNEPAVVANHDGLVWALAFAPDGKTLASAANDGTVKLWDVAAGRHRDALAHAGWVTSVAFAPDGETLAAGSADGIIKVWVAATGKEVQSWSGMAAGIYSVAFSPDGTLATAHEGGSTAAMQVKLWDPKTGLPHYALDMAKARIRSVAFSPDGKVLVGADEGGMVRLWRMNPTGEELAVSAHLIGYTLAYSPTGDELATGGGLFGLAGDVRLWDAKTGAARPLAGTHKAKVIAVAYSPGGEVLASGAADGTIKLWNPKSGAALGTYDGHAQEVRCIAMAHKARLAASGGRDGTVHVWNPDTRAEVRRLDGHGYTVMGAAFSPDDATLVTAGHDKTIRLWDVSTGKERARWETGSRVYSLALSADGKTLFTGEEATLRARDMTTGAVLHTGAGHTGALYGIAVSMTGRTMATASEDGSVKLWELDGLREIVTLSAGKTLLRGVALSPDGKAVAAIGIDGRLRSWR